MSHLIEAKQSTVGSIPPEVWNNYVEQYRAFNLDALSARWQQGALLEEIFTDHGQFAIDRLAFEEAIEEDFLIGLMSLSQVFKEDELRQELSLGHHVEIATHYDPELEGGRTPIEWLDFASKTRRKPEQLRGSLDWYYDTRGEVYNNFWGLYHSGQLDLALRKHDGKFLLMGHEIHPQLITEWQKEIKTVEREAREKEEERIARIRRREAVEGKKEEELSLFEIAARWRVRAIDKNDALSKLSERLGKKAAALLGSADGVHITRIERKK